MPPEQIITGTERERNDRLPAFSLHLDLIRGLAALVVFYGHLHLIVTGHGSVGGDVHGLAIATHPVGGTALPHAAVVVFFVLSGYLVGGSVLRDVDRQRFSWSSYTLRRLTRLWTVLIPAMVIGTLLDLTTERFFSATRFFHTSYFTSHLNGAPSLSNFGRYLFFLQAIDWFQTPRFGTNGALWSLSCEFWYYLFFPILALCFSSSHLSRTVRCGLAALLVALMVFAGPRISLSFPIWLFGVAAYSMPAKIPKKAQNPLNGAFAILFLLVLYVLRSRPLPPLLADYILALSFTVLVYGLVHRSDSVRRSLYFRLSHALALPSYTLYACHIPMTVLSAAFLAYEFPNIFRHPALAMTLIFVTVFANVVILYRLFERNTDGIRRFIEKRMVRQPTAQVQAPILTSL